LLPSARGVLSPPVRSLVCRGVAAVVAACLLAFLFQSYLWNQNPFLWHTVLETTGLSILLVNCFIIWTACDYGERINRLVCFGFLAAAVFKTFHAWFYLNPEGRSDLSLWYGVMGFYTRVLVLALWLHGKRTGANRWLCLAATLSCSLAISLLVRAGYHYLPALLAQHSGTLFKKAAEGAILAACLFALAGLQKKPRGKPSLTGNGLPLAVTLLAGAGLCFAVFGPGAVFGAVLGHVLTVGADVCLLQAVVSNAFGSPLRAVETERETLLTSQVQTILNSISNAVFVLDTNQDIVMCNKAMAEMVKMDVHEILGLNVSEFYRLASITRRDYSGLGERGQTGNPVKLTVFSPDGGKKEMLASETPVYNQKHELTGTIVVGTDVTLLRIEQQKNQQKERLVILGQMAAGIVHEIKNPLTVIKGFSQIIKLITEDNRIMEYIKQIDNETERINKVVTDFLRFARPRPPAFQRLAANELIDSVTMLIESNTFVRGIETVIERGQGDLTVLADADQLKQVLLNIAQNGIDALSGVERPRLKITSGFNASTGEVYISIANNGKPLTTEEKMRMGTPFYSTKEKGTGLGLSICYQIIKEHNGRIDIESEAGRDTVFTVSLPHYSETARGEKNLAAM